MKIRSTSIFPLLIASSLLASCGSDGDENAVRVRELAEEEQKLNLVATSAERFRYQVVNKQHDHGASAPHGSGSGSSSASGAQLTYETPEGWKVLDAAMMRDVNLSFGPEGKGECYLTRLPGAGGGLDANVNRWRKQMGAEELTSEEIAALPKKPLFGQEATFIKVDGNFGGMSGGEGKKDYRLLGLILSSDMGAVFVKMIGPKAVVEANEAGFDQFTSTLDVSIE